MAYLIQTNLFVICLPQQELAKQVESVQCLNKEKEKLSQRETKEFDFTHISPGDIISSDFHGAQNIQKSLSFELINRSKRQLININSHDDETFLPFQNPDESSLFNKGKFQSQNNNVQNYSHFQNFEIFIPEWGQFTSVIPDTADKPNNINPAVNINTPPTHQLGTRDTVVPVSGSAPYDNDNPRVLPLGFGPLSSPSADDKPNPQEVSLLPTTHIYLVVYMRK